MNATQKTGMWDRHAVAIIALLGQTTNSTIEKAACSRFNAREESKEDVALLMDRYREFCDHMKNESREIRKANICSFASMSDNRLHAKSKADALRHVAFRLKDVATLKNEFNGGV